MISQFVFRPRRFCGGTIYSLLPKIKIQIRPQQRPILILNIVNYSLYIKNKNPKFGRCCGRVTIFDFCWLPFLNTNIKLNFASYPFLRISTIEIWPRQRPIFDYKMCKAVNILDTSVLIRLGLFYVIYIYICRVLYIYIFIFSICIYYIFLCYICI